MQGHKPIMSEIRLQIQDPHWRDDAACGGLDPEIFFPLYGNKEGEKIAKRVCATCPVADACLKEALAAGHEYGVWGGLSEGDRSKLKRSNILKYDIQCFWCDRSFIGNAERKFCGKECWQAYIRHRSRTRKLSA